MQGLQIKNGDLAVDAAGNVRLVTGRNKLVQDLTLWLLEEYGVGFCSPSFGSFLESYIGEDTPQLQISKVQTEIQRILGLYQQNQLMQLQGAQTKAQLSFWNKSEIINSINSVTATSTGTTINVSVTLTTLANTTLPLTLIITPNGFSVSPG